jgi:hypothetical protein
MALSLDLEEVQANSQKETLNRVIWKWELMCVVQMRSAGSFRGGELKMS